MKVTWNARKSLPVMSRKQQQVAAKELGRKSKRSGRCEMIMCIDEKSGMMKFVRASQGCPRGYIKKAIDAARKGVVFPPDDDED